MYWLFLTFCVLQLFTVSVFCSSCAYIKFFCHIFSLFVLKLSHSSKNKKSFLLVTQSKIINPLVWFSFKMRLIKIVVHPVFEVRSIKIVFCAIAVCLIVMITLKFGLQLSLWSLNARYFLPIIRLTLKVLTCTYIYGDYVHKVFVA